MKYSSKPTDEYLLRLVEVEIRIEKRLIDYLAEHSKVKIEYVRVKIFEIENRSCCYVVDIHIKRYYDDEGFFHRFRSPDPYYLEISDFAYMLKTIASRV